jgi:hypothetical protein
MDHTSIASVWQAHSQASWPQLSNSNYLDNPEGLDPARITILQDCIADLDNLLDDLSDEPLSYFRRLRLLAELLLAGPR